MRRRGRGKFTKHSWSFPWCSSIYRLLDVTVVDGPLESNRYSSIVFRHALSARFVDFASRRWATDRCDRRCRNGTRGRMYRMELVQPFVLSAFVSLSTKWHNALTDEESKYVRDHLLVRVSFLVT